MSDHDEWIDEQQNRLDVFLEEFEVNAARWKKDLKTLDHFRRSLEFQLTELVEDESRVPPHTGAKLRDLSKEMQRGEKFAKEVSATMKKMRDGLDREAEMMKLLRDRYGED